MLQISATVTCHWNIISCITRHVDASIPVHRYTSILLQNTSIFFRAICVSYFAVYKRGFETLFIGLCFAASAWTSSKGPSLRHVVMYSAWNASSHHVKIVVRMQKWRLAQHVAKILAWVSIGRLICKGGVSDIRPYSIPQRHVCA